MKIVISAAVLLLSSCPAFSQVLNVPKPSKKENVRADSLGSHTRAVKLQSVVVTGRRSTYVQGLDKKVFNVGSDLMSASGSLADLMQNIPSVQVDVDGSISLRGNENVEILINGKPSTMMNARTRADVLQQLPANDIERIEVITNPSAQYKPDGVNGIINIIMKKQHKTGLNGSVSANVGSQGRYNATATLNYSTGKVNLFASYGIRRVHMKRDVSDDRLRNDSVQSFIIQRRSSNFYPLSHIARLGADWNINAKNTLQFSGGYTYRSFFRPETISNINRDKNLQETFRSFRQRDDNEHTKSAEGSVDYTHTFGKDHELTADYSYSMLQGLEDNHYTTISTPGGETRDNTQIWQAYYQHLFRLAYHQVFNDDLKLNAGYELDALRTDLNYHVQNFENGVFVPDMGKTNDFTNYETNHALYATLEYRLKALGFMLGVRPELMQIQSRLHSSNATVSNNYFMVYPTLHTSYKLNERNELQLNYSLRVNRPEADDLNPFPEYQDPLSLKTGNPWLKPEKIHSVELGYQWRSGATTLLSTLYYHYTLQKLTTVVKYLSNSVLMTTKENLNSGSAAGLEMIFNTKLGNIATVNLSGNAYYDQINASKLGYASNKGSFAWSMSMNTNFTLFPGAMLQLNSRYLSSALLPQGKRNGTFVTNIGAKYDIPSTGIALTATMADVFGTFRKTYTIHTPQLQQRVTQYRDHRIFYIGAVWNFGVKGKKQPTLDYNE